MRDYPSDKQDQFMVRLPDGLREDIKTAAKENGRSMNSEIVARLTGQGISMRDKFAMAAMQGIVAQEMNPESCASEAYLVADAMLAYRLNPSPSNR
jgi:plasmid stability protein